MSELDSKENNMTPMQAAKKFKAMLDEKYGAENTTELVIWDKATCIEHGFGDSDVAICWEGGAHEWAIEESLTSYALSFHGLLLEPYNGFILNFYAE